MKNTLNLALLHLSIRYAKPDVNYQLILDKISEAAALGADMVLAPEMATSGYGFDNPAHAGGYAETLDGRFVSELRNRCAKTGCWVCVGMPLKGEGSNVIYNGALLIDNTGELRIEYHKVMAENHWAVQGDCDSSGVVDTPWGRVGILICSDTYYGLLPRMRKLQETDLLLVPANWPSSSLDPKRLWSVHARLNGMYVAVCNRTGKDRTLDCTNAVSCCYSPEGKVLFQGGNHESTIFSVSLPLYNGKLKTLRSISPYNGKKAFTFQMLSQDSVFSQEKQTGKLVIHACNGWQSHGVNKCEEVTSSVLVDNVQTTLFVCFGCRSKGETHFGRDAFRSSRVVRVRQITEADCSIDFPSDVSHKVNESIGVTLPFAQQVCGINIGVVSHETTRHPEYLFQLAQSGCDVCVIFGKGNGHVDDVLYNCVHRMIVVFNDDGKIHVAIPPNGHETWREEISHETGFCTAVVPLDTVRSKEWLQKVAHCLQLIPETAEA